MWFSFLFHPKFYDSWICCFSSCSERCRVKEGFQFCSLKKKSLGRSNKIYFLRGKKGMSARGSIWSIQGVGSSVSQALTALNAEQDNQVLLWWQPPSQKWCYYCERFFEIIWWKALQEGETLSFIATAFSPSYSMLSANGCTSHYLSYISRLYCITPVTVFPLFHYKMRVTFHLNVIEEVSASNWRFLTHLW